MKDKQLAFILTIVFILFGSTVYILILQKDTFLNKAYVAIKEYISQKQKPNVVSNPNNYPGVLKISSTVFQNFGEIPTRYTCNGNDINPPLNIEGVPDEAKSLVLTMQDPDAPYKTWTHWILYNINPLTLTISEAAPTWKFTAGQNDFGTNEYRGPCPPVGKHRYIFKLYALDESIELENSPNISEIEEAIKTHILDAAELTGSYEKL